MQLDKLMVNRWVELEDRKNSFDEILSRFQCSNCRFLVLAFSNYRGGKRLGQQHDRWQLARDR